MCARFFPSDTAVVFIRHWAVYHVVVGVAYATNKLDSFLQQISCDAAWPNSQITKSKHRSFFSSSQLLLNKLRSETKPSVRLPVHEHWKIITPI